MVATVVNCWQNVSWRIVTSDIHSIVWDGDKTIWDANYLANGTPVQNSWNLTAEQESSKILDVGKYLMDKLHL